MNMAQREANKVWYRTVNKHLADGMRRWEAERVARAELTKPVVLGEPGTDLLAVLMGLALEAAGQ
jgi:hypothetical protein